MSIEELYENFFNFTKNRKYQDAIELIKESIAKYDPQELLSEVIAATLNNLQSYSEEGYESVSAFQVLATAKIIEDALEQIKPLLKGKIIEDSGNKKIILGNIFQDHHALGKKIIKIVLESNGFEVIDLGESVPASKFAETAAREGAKWILISAMMYNTALGIEKVKEELIKRKLNDVKIIAGGAPFNFHQGLYKKVKADFMAKDSNEILEVLHTRKMIQSPELKEFDSIKYQATPIEDRMDPLERVLATVTGKIPDRVPIFPLTTSIGAKILNISLPSLYRSAENIFKGQIKFQEKLGHDYVTPFLYLAKDAECWGAKTIYFENGEPNIGKSPFQNLNEILQVETPSVNDCESYEEQKKAIRLFADSKLKGKVPIVGVVTGPFSLPSLFFDVTKWLETLIIDPIKYMDVINKVMPFSIETAKLQVELGVDIVLFVDGIASNTMIPRELFESYVIPVYKQITSNVKAPVILGGAGGRFQDVLSKIVETGVIGVTLSAHDNLLDCKRTSQGKLTLLGNINNIEYLDWSPSVIEQNVKNAIIAGTENLTKPGFILMNQHSFPSTITLEMIELMVKIGKNYGQYK